MVGFNGRESSSGENLNLGFNSCGLNSGQHGYQKGMEWNPLLHEGSGGQS
jgi:hypothetical protein